MKENEIEDVLGGMVKKFEFIPKIETNESTSVPFPQPERTESDESLNRTLEESANRILTLLSPSIKDYILEVADIVLKIPRWQLLLGTLISQYQSGNITAPYIDPAWQTMEVIAGSTICEGCHQSFMPKRFGQKFCSEGCSLESRKAAIKSHQSRVASREFL